MAHKWDLKPWQPARYVPLVDSLYRPHDPRRETGMTVEL